ncbi:MAG TPA: glutathione S-transferase family protein [Candidatus Binatia bacterium]|nr:glutathione S-transferase family protein [Candidatus Binatia bacterium]
MPSTPLLHQYDSSPFSEKIRKVFAHKKLAWQAVEQPNMMPKPDLLPLTGGYRRIPVLQIGADVYCDTQLIVRVLERLAPDPTLYPGGSEGTCHAWALWADRLLFLPVVAVVFAEIGHLVPPAFIEDRTKMMPGRNFADIPKQAPHAREQVRSLAALLDTQLADGRQWLLGNEFSLADAACFHPLWFLRVAPAAGALLERFARLRGWFERVDALGQGQRSDATPAEALAIAKESRPVAATGVQPGEPNALTAGARVTVTPDDYGFDPVEGDLINASTHELAVRRTDPTTGELVVHFPRIGFRVTLA